MSSLFLRKEHDEMKQKLGFFSTRWGIVVVGALIGVIAVTLQKLGNPANMGVCMACFLRDTAGALGLHRAAMVQYLRPEIPAFILGSFVAALFFGEFRFRTGSAPIVRFGLGMFAMIGALIFLGCPWRALLRLAGGDWNAIVGIAGLIVGVAVGVLFLKRGFTLGRSYHANNRLAWLIPPVAAVLLILVAFYPSFGDNMALFRSVEGPGSKAAPIVVSLGAGLIIGFLAQRTRFCTMGSIRDVVLMNDWHLASGVIALLVAAFGVNLLYGQFHPGFTLGVDEMGKVINQPAAHTVWYLNFGGMVLAGLSFALAGGCPGRQIFLTGEGDGDAGVFVLGMLTGAAVSHNFNAVGAAPFAVWAMGIGLVTVLVVGLLSLEKGGKR
jgi:YedE family putative selenium metabolism protein